MHEQGRYDRYDVPGEDVQADLSPGVDAGRARGKGEWEDAARRAVPLVRMGKSLARGKPTA